MQKADSTQISIYYFPLATDIYNIKEKPFVKKSIKLCQIDRGIIEPVSYYEYNIYIYLHYKYIFILKNTVFRNAEIQIRTYISVLEISCLNLSSKSDLGRGPNIKDRLNLNSVYVLTQWITEKENKKLKVA